MFCDGDFWHGRDWDRRKQRLQRGTNANYWVAKIESNRARDARIVQELENLGWTVLRFWETDIRHHPDAIVEVIAKALARS